IAPANGRRLDWSSLIVASSLKYFHVVAFGSGTRLLARLQLPLFAFGEFRKNQVMAISCTEPLLEQDKQPQAVFGSFTVHFDSTRRNHDLDERHEIAAWHTATWERGVAMVEVEAISQPATSGVCQSVLDHYLTQ